MESGDFDDDPTPELLLIAAILLASVLEAIWAIHEFLPI